MNGCHINTFRPRQHGRHFPDDIFKCIFLNESVWTSIKVPLKFIPKGPIDNIPALVQIMAWRRPGDKPLSEPMMVSLLTLICVTRRQCVNFYLLQRSHLWLRPHEIYELWSKNPHRNIVRQSLENTHCQPFNFIFFYKYTQSPLTHWFLQIKAVIIYNFEFKITKWNN